MWPDPRCRILLVEGVPGIGKSSLIDRVTRRYIACEAEGHLRTLVTLAQTHTYGPLAAAEDSRALTAEDNIAHLNRLVSALEWLAEHARGQPRTKTFIVIDTLHLTHCMRPGVLRWHQVTTFDTRLAAIGCKLLLLDARDETVKTRTVRSRAETEFIRGYALGRFGRDAPELIEHFCRERDEFRRMYKQSCLEKIALEAERSAEWLADVASRYWLEAHAGLA